MPKNFPGTGVVYSENPKKILKKKKKRKEKKHSRSIYLTIQLFGHVHNPTSIVISTSTFWVSVLYSRSQILERTSGGPSSKQSQGSRSLCLFVVCMDFCFCFLFRFLREHRCEIGGVVVRIETWGALKNWWF